MKLLTRKGVLVEEQGQTYMADDDADSDEGRTLRPLQAAACTSTHLVMSPLEFMQRLAARATEGRPTGARATPQSPPCADDRAAGRSLAHDAPEVVTSDGLKPRAASQSPGVPPTFVCPLRPEHRPGATVHIRPAAFLFTHQRAGGSSGGCCLTRITVQGASIATLIGTVATNRCICRPWVAAPITIMLTWLPCA